MSNEIIVRNHSTIILLSILPAFQSPFNIKIDSKFHASQNKGNKYVAIVH